MTFNAETFIPHESMTRIMMIYIFLVRNFSPACEIMMYVSLSYLGWGRGRTCFIISKIKTFITDDFPLYNETAKDPYPKVK